MGQGKKTKKNKTKKRQAPTKQKPKTEDANAIKHYKNKANR